MSVLRQERGKGILGGLRDHAGEFPEPREGLEAVCPGVILGGEEGEGQGKTHRILHVPHPEHRPSKGP